MKIAILAAVFAAAAAAPLTLTNEQIGDGVARTPEQLQAIQDDADVNRECHKTNGGYLDILKPGNYQSSKFHNCFRTTLQINEYLDVLVKQNSKVITKFPVSKSVLGQVIHGYKISVGTKPKSLYFESLIHAREWITGASTVYTISRYLDDITKGVSTPADLYDLYFVPIVNPDGYDISWNGNRYQRKNKNEVDLNRNFPSYYPNPNPPKPGDQTYPGPKPFSEPETAGIDAFVKAKKDEFAGYVDIHANAASILYPYGDTYDPIGGGEDERFLALGKKMVKDMNETRYITEPSGALYLAYGCFDDFHYRTYKKPTLTLEMAGKDFVVPAGSIIQSGDEIYRGLYSFARAVRDFYGPAPAPTPSQTPVPSTTKPAC